VCSIEADIMAARELYTEENSDGNMTVVPVGNAMQL